MLKQVKGLSKSRFVRNVLIVATGTAGAQAITMAFAPIITRLYGPEVFGLLGTLMAILAIATPIAALTYPIAIVLPKTDKDALGLAKLSAGLAFIMAVLLAVLILLFGDGLAETLSMQSISGFLLLIPVAMLFSAFQQILQQWLIRKKQFKITAKVAVFQALALNSAKAGVGWFHPVGAALIILATLGSALHAFLLWLGIRKQPSARLALDQVETSEAQGHVCTVKELAHRHRDFPLYRAPQSIVSTLSMNIPIFMLATLFGSTAVGFYAISKTVLGLPSILISKSVSDVFYPKASEMYNKGLPITAILIRATAGLAVIGLVPLGIVFLFGPLLFGFVFGNEWTVAGEYARWLAVFMFFNFLNTPAVSVMPILRLQRWFLFYGLFSAGMRVAGLLIGYAIYKEPVGAIAFFALFGSAAYTYLIMVAFLKSRRKNQVAC